MHVLAGEVVGVFAHVERADENRAGRFQPLDQRGVALGRRIRAVDLRAGDGRQSGDVEQVLHREGHAGERAELLLPRRRGVDRLGAGARALGGDGGEGVEHRIALADARERILDHGERARLARGNRRGDLARRRPGRVGGHGSGRKDGRGLGIVRQFKFGDQRRVLERDVEIGLHRRLPLRPSPAAPARARTRR